MHTTSIAQHTNGYEAIQPKTPNLPPAVLAARSQMERRWLDQDQATDRVLAGLADWDEVEITTHLAEAASEHYYWLADIWHGIYTPAEQDVLDIINSQFSSHKSNDACRLLKAVDLLISGYCRPTANPKIYTVKSQVGDHTYTVHLEDGCGCADNRPFCKHLYAANILAMLAAPIPVWLPATRELLIPTYRS